MKPVTTLLQPLRRLALARIQTVTTPRSTASVQSASTSAKTSSQARTFVTAAAAAAATMAATSTDLARYKLNHTVIRVTDPKASVAFYEFLGMSLLAKAPEDPAAGSAMVPSADDDVGGGSDADGYYFLGYGSSSGAVSDRQGVVALTRLRGASNNKPPNNGNEEPYRGFGHTCVAVDHLRAACRRLDAAGHRFQKRPEDGRMRHIAFVKDPDGYWVELIARDGGGIDEEPSGAETDPSTYRMNHTMLRVKDAKKSLRFYQDVMGMSLLRTNASPAGGFTLYFLGYQGPHPDRGRTGHMEGLLELTWNHGTETDDAFRYHNGNDEPQGFGHIAVSVDNIEAACKRFDDLGCGWRKRLSEGRTRDVAFLLDPDGYSVKLVQNESLDGRNGG